MQNSVAEQDAVTRPGLPSIPWTPILWFGLLLIVCYASILTPLIHVWETDEDMGHGFLVPVIAGYIVWIKREKLATLPVRTNWWGLAVVVWSCLQLTVAHLGAENFLARTSIVLCIAGMVLLLGGTEYLKELIFPICLLFFMVPLPNVIYTQITFPLQLFASAVAEQALSMLGIPVLREGNVIDLASQRLSVVEACSGIRSLLSLTFLSLIYGFFFEARFWIRAVLFFSTIPIAIFTNSMRVTVTGILSEFNPQLAQGVFHTMEGWVVFIIALALLFLVHRVLLLMDRRFYPVSSTPAMS